MLIPKLVTAAASKPVSLVEAKLHLRIDHNDEDTLIDALIDAATETLDGWSGLLGRCLITQTWKIALPGFCSGRIIRLPYPDIVSDGVTIKYFDLDDVEQTYAATSFSVLEDTDGGFVWLKSGEVWPTTNDRPDAVSVEFDAGYGDAAAVPAPIKAAILLKLGHLYEHREDVTTGSRGASLPKGAESLVMPYRRVQF